MMEDLAATNRRTKLPMRIIQDRPHEQNKKCYGGKKSMSRPMEKYKKHAQLEMPLRTRRNKWKLGERTKAKKRRKQLEKAYRQARKGKQVENNGMEKLKPGKTDR